MGNRINIIGTSGSGKSTFARQLATKKKIPYIELDKIFWEKNWQMPSDDIFFARLKTALTADDKWVLDGNYTRTIPIKWEKIDAVIWLDFSFPLTLFRAIKRALNRAISQKELWEGTGNRESFRRSFFSKESIIWWTITTHKKVRKNYTKMIADPKFSHIKFVRLKNPAEAKRFLATVAPDSKA